MAVESDALARGEADDPHTRALVFGEQRGADAGIGVHAFARELGGDIGRPLRRVFLLSGLIEHGESHGDSSGAINSYIEDNRVNGKIEAHQLSESKPKRAIIIGGSMSGLLSGLMLRRSGWDVDIYERVESELSGRGAGIVAQPELMQRLRGLGLETEGLGVHIGTRKILDAQGRLINSIECPQVATAWERVYRLLRDAFPAECYHRGHIFVKFTQTPEAVTAYFSEGETFTADVLVGADGIRSTVRQQCLPAVQPRYAG